MLLVAFTTTISGEVLWGVTLVFDVLFIVDVFVKLRTGIFTLHG